MAAGLAAPLVVDHLRLQAAGLRARIERRRARSDGLHIGDFRAG